MRLIIMKVDTVALNNAFDMHTTEICYSQLFANCLSDFIRTVPGSKR